MSWSEPWAAPWSAWANVEVQLGLGPSWEPDPEDTALWDTAVWDVDRWTSIFGVIPFDVTAAVTSVSIDSGRQSLFDPGTSARATVVLFDPSGAFGLASNNSALGAVVFIRASSAGGSQRSLFLGKVVAADGDESLLTPYVTLRADDALGIALAPDDIFSLPFQYASQRMNAILDRASWPPELRDIQPDLTFMAELDVAGSRLDAARNTAWDTGGTLWATGDGVITYRNKTLSDVNPWPPRYVIGTDPGMVAPEGLRLSQAQAQVRNLISWSNRAGTVKAEAADVLSRSRYGWANEVRQDVTLEIQSAITARVTERLDALAWPVSAVGDITVPVIDGGSGELVTAAIGDPVLLYYGGADRFTRLGIVAQVSHRVDPEGWSVRLSMFDAAYLAGPNATWGNASWNLNTWGPAGAREVTVQNG